MKKLITAVLLAASLILLSLPASNASADTLLPATAKSKKIKVYKKFNLPTERTIILKGGINSNSADTIVNRLIELDDSKKKKLIYMVINSPGGGIVSGDRIITTLKAMDNKVICIVDGGAYSMAAVISLHCDKLYATENADFLFHEANIIIGGSMTHVKSRYKHFVNWLESYEEQVAKALDVPLDQYLEKAEDEWWLTSREAARQGFVDGIVKGLKYKVEEEESYGFFSWGTDEELIWLCGPTEDTLDPCYNHWK